MATDQNSLMSTFIDDILGNFELKTALDARIKLEERINFLKDEAKAAFKSRMLAEAQELGIDVKIDAPKVTPKPKYRNPAKPTQTWTGRGKPPAWFSTAMANGTSADSMLIPDADATV